MGEKYLIDALKRHEDKLFALERQIVELRRLLDYDAIAKYTTNYQCFDEEELYTIEYGIR